MSCSTTGGVHRVDGIVISTGPDGPSERSGMLTSCPCSSGWSLDLDSRPLTVMIPSSMSIVLASW